MQTIPGEWLSFLREQFPSGSHIQLIRMGNDPSPIPAGSSGKLEQIDDVGQFHVQPPALQLLKLYMPLTADLHKRDDYGDLSEVSAELDGRDIG